MASAPGEDGKLSYELGMIMKRLWADSGVQACFHRSRSASNVFLSTYTHCLDYSSVANLNPDP
jgi:hypothetical protein